MALTILKDTKNALLGRQEILAASQAAKTPTFDEVKAELASATGKDAELVIVKEIRGKYGSNEFSVKAYIYDSKESAVKIEPKPKQKAAGAAAA